MRKAWALAAGLAAASPNAFAGFALTFRNSRTKAFSFAIMASVVSGSALSAELSSKLYSITGSTYSFQASNFPDRRIKHRDFLAFLDQVDISSSQLTKNDFSFLIRRGLANSSCYSFESKRTIKNTT